MSLSTQFPTSVPSLLLDFANTKRLDPRITFARASTARYYDGKTFAKAEENLFLQSQEVNNFSEKNAVTVTSNTETAPDGTATADVVAADGSSAQHFVGSNAIAVTGTNTFSVFLKAGTGVYAQLFYLGDTVSFVNFDLTAGAGAVGTSGGTATGSIVDAGGGWYRCIAVNTSSAPTRARICIVDSSSAARAPVLTTSATVIVWGAQLEQRSAATAYTATTTQPITRYQPQLLTAAANVARFDHNPITGESLGLLIEESRSNLLTFTEDFADAAWTKSNASIVANAAVAPDGTLTADKLIPNNTATNGLCSQSASVTASTAYTLSCYAKAAEQSVLVFVTNIDGGFVAVSFNLLTGVASPPAGWAASMVNVGNGWYRCVATGTASTTTSRSIQISNNGAGWTGDGYSGIYIWGAQLEAGAFPTSYVARVDATAASRAADAATMTGTAFSSWYNPSAGTLYSEASFVAATATDFFVFRLWDSGGASSNPPNRLDMVRQTSTGKLFFSDFRNGANDCLIDLGVVAGGVFLKASHAYAENNFAAAVAGNSAVVDTSGGVPSNINQLIIGNRSSGDGALNGYIRKIGYYPTRLTNAQLQALTR